MEVLDQIVHARIDIGLAISCAMPPTQFTQEKIRLQLPQKTVLEPFLKLISKYSVLAGNFCKNSKFDKTVSFLRNSVISYSIRVKK